MARQRPPAKSPLTTLEDLKASLDQLQAALRKSAEKERQWKALDLINQTFSGLGYLVVGTAVPTLAAGAANLTWTTLFVNIAPGGFLAWFGVVLLKTAITLKGHFLDHPNQLPSFLEALNAQDKTAGKQVLEWIDRPELKGTRLRRNIRKTFLVFRIGLGAVLGMAAIFLALNLLLDFLILRTALGFWWAVGLEIVIVIIYAASIPLMISIRKRGKTNAASAAPTRSPMAPAVPTTTKKSLVASGATTPTSTTPSPTR